MSVVQPEEIREIAVSLNPPAFFSRIDLWRKGDLSGAQYEPRVGGTRAPKMPTFDRTDIALNQAEADYRAHLQGVSVAMAVNDHREALKLLRQARALEVKWLFPIEPASEWVQKMASDSPSCNDCGETKEAWVKRQKKRGVKTPLWRLWAGDCHACYKRKERVRLAELKLIEAEQGLAS